MIKIKRKARKAVRTWRREGAIRLARLVALKVLEDRALLGRIVELRGNRATLNGCLFSLEDPSISTALKSRFLLGSYEFEACYLIKKYLPCDTPVVELGACLGVVSCLTNQLLDDPSAHFVVEANTRLLSVLEANRAANRCQFHVLNAALAYGVDEVTFFVNERCNEGSVTRASESTVTVPSTTLADVLRTAGHSPVNLICDIEGMEAELVAIEGDVLQQHVDWMVLELHGTDDGAALCEQLESMGFDLIERFDHNCVFRNQRFVATPPATDVSYHPRYRGSTCPPRTKIH